DTRSGGLTLLDALPRRTEQGALTVASLREEPSRHTSASLALDNELGAWSCFSRTRSLPRSRAPEVELIRQDHAARPRDDTRAVLPRKRQCSDPSTLVMRTIPSRESNRAAPAELHSVVDTGRTNASSQHSDSPRHRLGDVPHPPLGGIS